MNRLELSLPKYLLLLAGLGLTNACYIQSSDDKDEGTGGASAGSGGQTSSGGSAGQASGGSGGQTSSGGSGGQTSSGGSAGQASGGSAGQATGGAGGATGGSGGSSAGLPWPVKSCNDLCQYQPVVTSDETQCVTVQAELHGYPVTSTASCLGILSVAQCIGCYAAVKMSDTDCAAIGNTCLK